MARGRLITVEGLDGAGKTTLVAGLARELGAEVLREPGGVVLSERIRALVKDPELRVGARAEALLYAAARAQLVEERLEPLLAAGRLVLLDPEPAAGRRRLAGRGEAADRLEREAAPFFAAIAAAYDALAAADPGRVRVVDAEQPPERVLADALAALQAP